MPFTHYYGLIGDSHTRGRRVPAPLVVDRVLGQRIVVLTPPSPAPELNCIVRGATSGAMARITRIVSDTEWIVQSMAGALGLGIAFSQNNNLPGFPFTGETLTLDNGGSTTVRALGGDQYIPASEQYGPQHGQKWLNDFVPPDQSDFTWWDGNAKAARQVDVSSLSGTWNIGDRVQTSAGGQFTIILKPASASWKVVRVTGAALAVGQTLTNLTTPGGAATIAVLETDPPVGNWVPYTVQPNGTGIMPDNSQAQDTYWERLRNGNGTDGGEPSFGPENRLIHRAFEFWQQQADIDNRAIRVLPFSSNDGVTFPDGILGGVVIQVVTCSGTFPTTWTVGETVTGGGGWSAKVHGWNSTSKLLFVHTPNGQTLTAGAVTGGTSGAVATATGAALGWQPGSTHWNRLIAEITKATAATQGKWSNGSGVKMDVRWEGVALMIWESEIAVHSATYGCPLLTGETAKQQWVTFLTQLRSSLGRADLPIAVWKHRIESQRGVTGPFGIPISFFVQQLIDELPALVPGVAVVASDAYEMAAPPVGVSDPSLWLETDAYLDLGDDFWRALQWGATTVAPGNFERVPVGIVLGQSQATGFIAAAAMLSLDRDPDLWPSTTFSVGVDTTDPNALSWNTRTEALEPFHCAQNANGFWGTNTGTCGSEVPLVARMKMRFSDTAAESARFILFKATVPGSCVNKNVPDATATWDPELTSRTMTTASLTVTALAATSTLPARGRFTGAAGTFNPSIYVIGLSLVIDGSALGVLGAGGNDSPPWTVQRVRDVAGDGSWIEVEGPFVPEGPRTFSITAGPPPIWPELVRQWKLFLAACNELQIIPQPSFIYWEQGESDLGLVGEYEAALRRFWAALEPMVGMRLKGEEKIAKCIVKTTKNTPWPVPDADIDQLRAIQTSVAAELGNAVVIDPSDLSMEYAGYVRRTNRLQNGVHFTARAMITKGFRVDAALATLGPTKGIPAHPVGELAVDFGAVDGGATASGAADSRSLTGDEDSETASVTGSKSLAAPTAEQAQSLVDAMFDSPDVAAYTTPSGLQVTRRSAADLIMLQREADARAARARGIRQTLVRFD